MNSILNFQILRHPMNWIIVFLMVFIVSLAVHFVLQYQTGGSAAKKQQAA
jgi:hypothetical protein